jgi:hypothetical protein
VRGGEGETGGRHHEVGSGGVAGRKEEVSGCDVFFSVGIAVEMGIEPTSVIGIAWAGECGRCDFFRTDEAKVEAKENVAPSYGISFCSFY